MMAMNRRDPLWPVARRAPRSCGRLLADNYNLVATANHKGTKAQRTHKEIRGGPPALRSLRGHRLWAGPSGLASLVCGRALGRAPAWARVPAWACGLGGRSGRDHGFHAKARSSDERTIFAMTLGPRRWSRFSTKAHPGRKPPSARRARLPGKRSCQLSWGLVEPGLPASGKGSFPGAGF
jgi:hypothetical protein